MSLCDRDFRQSLCHLIRMNRLKLVLCLKQDSISGVFLQVCEFLHNDGFFRIILQIFGWLLLDFLLLNWLYVNVIKIINLTILKVYSAKLTRISFLMKSRFVLSDYCTGKKVPASLCIQPEWGKMRTLFTQCRAVRDAN